MALTSYHDWRESAEHLEKEKDKNGQETGRFTMHTPNGGAVPNVTQRQIDRIKLNRKEKKPG